MNEPWYYLDGGERRGPISTIELKQRVADGKLREESPVWREGFTGWVIAGRVPGLFEVSRVPEIQENSNEQPNAFAEIEVHSEQLPETDQSDIHGGRLMHFALWSTVAIVAIACGSLIWLHEAEKNYKLQVVRLCKEVQSEIRQEDDEAAENAFERLNQLIGDREIPWKLIATEIKKTQRKFAPVAERINQAREETQLQELAEATKRAAAEAEENRRRRREAASRSEHHFSSSGNSSWEDKQLELVAQKYGMTLYEARRMYDIQGKLDSGQTLSPDERSFMLAVGIKIMK